MKKILFLLLTVIILSQIKGVAAQTSKDDIKIPSGVHALQVTQTQYLVKPALIIPKNITVPVADLNQYKNSILSGLTQIQQFYASKLDGHTFSLAPTVIVINSTQDLNPSLYNSLDQVNVLEGQKDCESNTVKISWVFGSQNLTNVGGSYFTPTVPRVVQPCGYALLNHTNLNQLFGELGASEKDRGLGAAAHELGHGFDLVYSGFAKGHTCAQGREVDCESSAPLPLPPAAEAQGDMMYYAISPLSTRNINNTTHNPEVWKLFQRPFINPNNDPAPAPVGSVINFQISGLSPAIVDQGQSVTINGSDFGNNRGTVSLANSKNTPGIMQNFSITSWSNTQIQIQINRDALSLPYDTTWQVKVTNIDGRFGTFDSLTIKSNVVTTPQLIINIPFSVRCGGSNPMPGVKIDLATTSSQPVVALTSVLSNSNGEGQLSYTATPTSGQSYYLVPAIITDSGLASSKNFVVPTPAPAILNVATAIFNYPNCPANLLPDLTTTSTSVIDSDLTDPLTEGEITSFSAVVYNAGNHSSSQSTTRFSVDNQLVCNDSTGVLGSNGSESEICQDAWTASAGTHTLTVCADATSSVPESNEGNDCLARSFTVNAVTIPTPSKITVQGVRINSVHGYFDPGTTITSGSDSTAGSNPYSFQTNTGTVTVSSSIPSGYAVSYSLCQNTTDSSCHANFTSGSSVSFNLAQGFADIWWMYSSNQPTAAPLITNIGLTASPAPTCDSNNKRAVTIGWYAPSTAAHSYIVSKQASNQFTSWTTLTTTTSTLYTDLSTPGQGYKYKVEAYAGTSASGTKLAEQIIQNINVATCTSTPGITPAQNGTGSTGTGGRGGVNQNLPLFQAPPMPTTNPGLNHAWVYDPVGQTWVNVALGGTAGGINAGYYQSPTLSPIPAGEGSSCGGFSNQVCSSGTTCDFRWGTSGVCAGPVPPPPPFFGFNGTVFIDSNQNAVKDAGELGFDGATVRIVNSSFSIVSGTDSTGCTPNPPFFTCPPHVPGNFNFDSATATGASHIPSYPSQYIVTLDVPNSYHLTTPANILVNVIANYNPTLNLGIAINPIATPVPAPTCSFTGPTSLTTGVWGTYTSTSTGSISSYSWTSTPIGSTFNSPLAASTYWTSNSSQTFTITLSLTGPGGSSTCSNASTRGTTVSAPRPTILPTTIPTAVPTVAPTATPIPTSTPAPTSSTPANCSNLVDLILNSYNSQCGDAKYDKRADINKDKSINGQDYSSAIASTDRGVCQGYLDNNTDPCTVSPTPTPVPVAVSVTLSGQTKTITEFREKPFTIHLPGTVGVAQTFSIPVMVTYNNGSTKVSNWTFTYQPPSPTRSAPTAEPRSTTAPTPTTSGSNFPASGLISYWKMDEATETSVSDSKGSNTATSNGSTIVTGKIGNARGFSGNSFLSTANLESTLGNTASLTFWIKTSYNGNNTFWVAPAVSGVESGDTNDIRWGWIDESGKIHIDAGNGNSAASTKPINDNNWHFIVLTRDSISGQVQVYVDSSLSGSAISETGAKTTPITTIGRRLGDFGGSNGYLNGTLDEMGIWNRILTNAEISTLYNSGSGLGL